MDGEQMEKKKERPQNANLKPLGSGQRSPEEEKEIRRKGQAASIKKRKENADFRKVVRTVMNAGKRKGRVVDFDSITSLEEAEKQNTTNATAMVIRELQHYLETGDKESRDWLVHWYGPESVDSDGGVTIPLGQDGSNDGPGVRIQLIRGTKQAPTTPGAEQTQAAAEVEKATPEQGTGEPE